jgi:hypothetical protein
MLLQTHADHLPVSLDPLFYRPNAKHNQAQPSTTRYQLLQIQPTGMLKMLDLGVQITGILSGAFLTGQW